VIKRFLIVGLPRSGSTYLATLLHSHPDVYCGGELFNPSAIIGIGWKDENKKILINRDAFPADFLRNFYLKRGHEAVAVGAKYMIGHHPEIISMIEENSDIKIIFIHRNNRLAQSASWFQALQSKQWATQDATQVDQKPLDMWPRQLLQKAREFESSDYFFANWLRSLSNNVLDVEYREMFSPKFNKDICNFLGVPFNEVMCSPLAKQGLNNILDRFEHKKSIEQYFREVGRQDWLDQEI